MGFPATVNVIFSDGVPDIIKEISTIQFMKRLLHYHQSLSQLALYR